MAELMIQEHVLKDGTRIEISRNGNHQYSVRYPGQDFVGRMASVTTLNKHTEGDTFGIGVNWATKLIRESGNFNAPREDTSQSILQGTALHECIERYIKSNGKDIDEENDMFTAWLKDVGSKHNWLASEVFLYHPALSYGGTADAISIDTETMETVIWDWKTKNRATYEKYGPSLSYKDHAQLAAYANALDNMGSIYAPTKGNIVYIMRDGSYADLVQVDLRSSTEVFGLSVRMAHATASLKASIKGGA